MYKPIDVANCFLNLAYSCNRNLTQLKIQKLVYIAHGFCLGKTGEALLDEDVKTWQYGPVIESLYHEFKGYGNGNIEYTNQYVNNDYEPEIKKYVTDVWNQYKDYTAFELVDLTHENGTPWSTSFHNGERTINNEYIKNYYYFFLKE